MADSPELVGPRRALVTGAGSGLGLGVVTRLRADGWSVVGIDINEVAAAAVEGTGARFLAADVSRADDWERAVATTNGGLELLVLNAGVAVFEPDVLAADLGKVERARGVNVDGVVLGVRACAPLLEADGGGDVVVVASLAALMPYPDDPYYAMTKHAALGFGRSAAPSLAKRGIRTTIFCPGVVDTPLVPDSVRSAVLGAGLELLSTADAAGHVLEAVDGAHERTGRIWTSQAHLGLVEYVPATVQLPRPTARRNG